MGENFIKYNSNPGEEEELKGKLAVYLEKIS
jgi:hypothetical protein